MNLIEELEKEAEKLVAEMGPLEKRLDKIRDAIRAEKSKEYIRVNGITKDSVIFSDDEGIPYCCTMMEFAGYVEKSNKPWAEWNGTIHRSSDIILHHWGETPAKVEHLIFNPTESK